MFTIFTSFMPTEHSSQWPTAPISNIAGVYNIFQTINLTFKHVSVDD